MRLWYQKFKNVYHWLQAYGWRLAYGRPDRGMYLYGVTGTNGKTTTCYVLTGILAAAHGGGAVGMLTTVAIRVGKQEYLNKTKLTTLGSRMVYRYLWQMRRRGVRYVAIELTSHALAQHRLAGLRLAGGIVLNVEREHLDYHGTMVAYARAKQGIISYLAPASPLVGKADDKWVRRILAVARKRSVGVHSYTIDQAKRVSTPLLGEFNKENVLAATLLARAVGVDESAIARGVAAVKQVPGRMEWLRVTGQPRVLIDYAVTPGALKRLYEYIQGEVQGSGNGKIFAILGAAGRRDRGKRPVMARVVSGYANELIITREDPWTEPEEQIFADLERGLVNTKIPWRRIADRREAIRYCLKKARPNDVVVVTGKGAETGMGMGKKIVPWSDRKVIEDLLREVKQA